MRRCVKDEQGVISLEACIVVPIFIFLILFFYGLIVMSLGQRMVAHALLQSAQSLSLDSYATEKDLGYDSLDHGYQLVGAIYSDMLGFDKEEFSSKKKWYSAGSADLEKTVENRFYGFLVGGTKAEATDTLKTIGISDVKFSGSSVTDGVLTIDMKYKQDFIYNFQGLLSFDRETTVKVKMWGL